MRTRLTLIQRIKNRCDEHSWQEFVDIYRPYIAVVVRNMRVNEAEIDDHVQSVLLICWNKLPDLDYNPGKGKFRFWLSRIANFTVVNHIRKAGRRLELQENFEIPLTVPPEVEQMADHEWKVFISKLAWENVKTTLSENAIYSFDELMKGRKPAEIAVEIGVEENTVHAHKSRIEKKLFSEIQHLKQELD
jgi:RNA polymerase sigma factor (sigma-70 family)